MSTEMSLDEAEFLEQTVVLQEIFDLLYKTHGVDFSKYKQRSVHRRIVKEMTESRIYDLNSYLDLLNANPVKLNKLFQTLLIPLTSFFRNEETFQVFKSEIVSEIVNRASLSKSIRVWVPGCSTGEEVYSILICLIEGMDTEQTNKIQLRVFGTDVNADALRNARIGKYSDKIVNGISKDRLERFFVKETNGYRISSFIRNMCFFARHNLLEDPPFFHLDVISCQNVLIYFNSDAQKHVFNLFENALNVGGCLILGKSETVPKSVCSLSRCEPRIPIFMKA